MKISSYINGIFYLCFLFNPSIVGAQSELSAVLTNLYQATGFFAVEQPIIKVSEYTSIAEYNKEHKIILINPEIYELCGQLSVPRVDALSVIIGHELAHHFLENSGGFALNNLSTRKDIERQADVHGLFIAHLAGFKALKAAPEVFEKIYSHFNLKDHTSQYPHFTERLKTKDVVIETVTQLVDIFKAGNYLTALGEYNFASACYRHITDKHFYFGKELHNNLGVVSTLYALNVYDEDIDYYLFPLEIDWQLRIDKPKLPADSKVSDSEKRRIRERYLQIAAQSFQIAHQLDPNYETAQINLMCVYAMQNQYAKAEDLWNKLANQYHSNSNIREQLDLILGIVYAKSNRAYEAMEIWRHLSSSNNKVISYQASYNLDILTDEQYKKTKSFICPTIPATLDNFRVNKFYSPEIQLLDRIYLQIKKSSTTTTLFHFENRTTKKVVDIAINNFPKSFSLSSKLQKKVRNQSQRFDMLHSSIDQYFLTCKPSGKSFLVNGEGWLISEARILGK